MHVLHNLIGPFGYDGFGMPVRYIMSSVPLFPSPIDYNFNSNLCKWSSLATKGLSKSLLRYLISESFAGALIILYHLIQFGSHASRGLPNRRNVTLVTGIFIRCWNHFVIWLSNIEFFGRLRRKTAENLQMSRWVWEVAETKTSSDASRVTWGAELN